MQVPSLGTISSYVLKSNKYKVVDRLNDKAAYRAMAAGESKLI